MLWCVGISSSSGVLRVSISKYFRFLDNYSEHHRNYSTLTKVMDLDPSSEAITAASKPTSTTCVFAQVPSKSVFWISLWTFGTCASSSADPKFHHDDSQVVRWAVMREEKVACIEVSYFCERCELYYHKNLWLLLKMMNYWKIDYALIHTHTPLEYSYSLWYY